MIIDYFNLFVTNSQLVDMDINPTKLSINDLQKPQIRAILRLPIAKPIIKQQETGSTLLIILKKKTESTDNRYS